MTKSDKNTITILLIAIILGFIGLFELCNMIFGADKTFLGCIFIMPMLVVWTIKKKHDKRKKEK